MLNRLKTRLVIRQLFAAAIYASITLFSSCSSEPLAATPAEASLDSVPDSAIVWKSAGGGFREWGCGGDCIYGVSVKPKILDVWKWNRDTIGKFRSINISDKHCLATAWRSDDKYVVYAWEEGKAREAEVYVRNGSTGQTERQFPMEKGWWVRGSRPSQNGKYVAVWALPNYSMVRVDLDARLLHVGYIGPETKEIEWVSTLPGPVGAETVGCVIPSDDGTYVAVAGWQHGAAVVNVPEKKCLWQKRPQSEACFNDIAFSPDSKLVYAGGTEGCVYGMKVKDGEIVSRWFATESGAEIYGHRISTISVSPDGRFVAAGTGPEGQVYLFSTKDGKCRILNHGGSTILITSFSPDSKRLASFAAGQIKIWKLPEEAAGPKPDEPEPDKHAAK